MSIWEVVARHKWFLVVLCGVAFCIRALFFVGYFTHERRYWNPDTRVYYEMAQSVKQQAVFANSEGKTTFYRVPGYPLFLAAVYTMFGNNDHAVVWIQILLGSLIPIFLFVLSLTMFPHHLMVARVVGVWGSVHPGLIIFSNMLMSETLSTLLFVCLCIVFFRTYRFFFEPTHAHATSWITWLSIGLLAGFVGIVRPVGHYLLGLLGVLLVVSNGSWQKRIARTVTVCVGWCVVLGPWLVRNYLLTGALLVHTLGGFHFLQHLAALVEMHHQQVPYHQALRGLVDEYDEHKKRLLQSGVDFHEQRQSSVARDVALRHIVAHPWLTLRLSVINMMKTIGCLYSGELLAIDQGDTPEYTTNRSIRETLMRFIWPHVSEWWMRLFIYIEILMYGLLLLGCVCSLSLLGYDRDYTYVFLKSMPFIGLFIFITLACGMARLRLPVELLMGILSIRYWIGERHKRKVV